MTVIKTKVERSYWKNVALSAVPDVLIAWAAMRLMDGGAEVFFGTLIALQAVYLALWIKRSAWSWLLFWLTNRSMMSSHIEEVLVQQRFPRPPDFISGPDEYYSGIVDDESVETFIRLKAAQELGIAGKSFDQLLSALIVRDDAFSRQCSIGKRTEALLHGELTALHIVLCDEERVTSFG